MTLMIGAVSADGSAAVLASDSMTKMAVPPGYRLRDKILEFALGGAPGGIFISSPGWVEDLPHYRDLKQIVYAAEQLARADSSALTAVPGARGWQHSPQVMLASRVLAPTEERRYMVLLTHAGQWAGGDIGHGAVMVGGTAAIWQRETNAAFTVPETIEQAEALVVGIANQVIAWWYGEDGMLSLDDYLARGILPPIAPPIRTATLLAPTHEVQRKEWNLCLTP